MLTIPKEKHVFKMDKDNEPAAIAQSGDTVLFDMYDCFTDEVKSEEDIISNIDFDRINPATGPLYIEGAKPGDVLKVTVEEIQLNDTAFVMTSPDSSQYFSKDIDQEQTVVVNVDDQQGTFEFLGQEFPINKHIGVMGVAPEGEGVTTGTPRMHGGNMDNIYLREGTTVYFPVHTEGALLAMGDMHADMGDSEIWSSGVEVGGSANVTVEVVKDFPHEVPLFETEDAYYSFGAADNFDEAIQLACDNLAKLIMEETGCTFNEAGMLMTFRGELAPCQIVNPDVSFRFGMKKEDIEKAKNFNS